MHTFKRQLKAYLFHIWCAGEQKEQSPPLGAVVAFSWFWRRIQTACLLTYLLTYRFQIVFALQLRNSKQRDSVTEFIFGVTWHMITFSNATYLQSAYFLGLRLTIHRIFMKIRKVAIQGCSHFVKFLFANNKLPASGDSPRSTRFHTWPVLK